MMKKLLTTLTILNLVITPVFAQEEPGCFLIDENGEYQSLLELCPNSETPISEAKKDNPPAVNPPTNPQTETTNSNENSTDTKKSEGNFFSIPIKKRVGGIPLIDVIINGSKSFEMLLDTGASITTITPTMEKELKIKSEQIVPIATAGGIIQSGLAKVESIQAGDLQVDNILVSLSSSLNFGLLGQNFYSNYDIIIKENVIEFHSRK
jgi:aspartyl protease family protein